MKHLCSARHWLLALALACPLVDLVGPWTLALATDSAPSQNSTPPGKPSVNPSDVTPSPAGPAKPQAEKRFETQLTVVVTSKDPTGKDQPVEHAEVKILSPMGPGGEPRTNAQGRVLFSLTGPANVKVRVIAEGWQSALVEVKLEEGKQRLQVQLTRLPD